MTFGIFKNYFARKSYFWATALSYNSRTSSSITQPMITILSSCQVSHIRLTGTEKHVLSNS